MTLHQSQELNRVAWGCWWLRLLQTRRQGRTRRHYQLESLQKLHSRKSHMYVKIRKRHQLTIRPMKNSKVLNSWFATRREPNQKIREITKKIAAWENEYNRLAQTAVCMECFNGSSKLLLYVLRQSFSRVSDATVRIAPAASQAIWADSSWAFLFVWSFKTTTRWKDINRVMYLGWKGYLQGGYTQWRRVEECKRRQQDPTSMQIRDQGQNQRWQWRLLERY